MSQRISVLLIPLAVTILALMSIAACSVQAGGRVIGGQPVVISELPIYPGATELTPGQSKIIEPIFGPAQRETPPFIGLGIEVVKSQRDFSVPPDTTFNQIKSFYSDKLKAGGWREDPAMRVFTQNANEQTTNLQGAIWVRVDQTLLIVLARNPDTGEKELQLSIATR